MSVKKKPNTAAFIAFLVFMLAESPVSAFEFSQREIEQLAQGKSVMRILPESRQGGFYGGVGFAIVDAPIEAIWAFFQDWDAYPEAFPRTVETKEISQIGDHSLVRMKIGYKVLSIVYHLTIIRDWKKKTISFSLVKNKPHDIKSTRGYWRLFPQKDGRTLVCHVVALNMPPGMVAVLGEQAERELEWGLVGMPRYLKRYLEGPSGARYLQMTAKKKE